MKKVIITCLALIIFIGCSNQQQFNNQREKLPLESFIDTFLTNNPNWGQNDIILKETNEKFRKELTEELKNNLLDNLPLKVGRIDQYKDNQYAVLLSYRGFDYKRENLPYTNVLKNTDFDVVSLVNDSVMRTLEKDKQYIIKGAFKEFLNNKYAFNKYIEGWRYSDDTELKKNEYNMTPSITICSMLYEISDIKPYN